MAQDALVRNYRNVWLCWRTAVDRQARANTETLRTSTDNLSQWGASADKALLVREAASARIKRKGME